MRDCNGGLEEGQVGQCGRDGRSEQDRQDDLGWGELRLSTRGSFFGTTSNLKFEILDLRRVCDSNEFIGFSEMSEVNEWIVSGG